MKCELRTMLTSTLRHLLLLSLTAGLCHAAPRASNNNELSDPSQPAVSGTTLGPVSTTMPNYLPQDEVRRSATNSQLSQVSTATTANTRITSKSTQSFQTNKLTGDAKTVISDPVTEEPYYVENIDATVLITPTTVKRIIQTTTSFTASTGEAKSGTETKTHSWIITSQSPNVSTTDMRSTEVQCNCSSEGSADDCDRHTGECVCLPGYAGPRCDICQADHYDNGTTGCIPCGCDSSGADMLQCDSSGVCVCKPGVYGDKCDECHPGYFRFSETGCQLCQCNNHSSSCHPQSGVCLNCQDNVEGRNCEQCKYNFYRRPGAVPAETCIPCPCSIVTSSGRCHIDTSGNPACDQCKPEYLGSQCEKCKDGYYNADSICQLCDCGNNHDPGTFPRICEPETGQCLSCLNHTAGKHCERCAEGYAGSPGSCRAIDTDPREPIAPTSSTERSMSSTSNVTVAQHTTTTASSSTTSLQGNATATVTEVSWSQFNIIILAVIIVALVVLMAVAGGVYTYREYHNRKLNAPFWTIELKEDNISFSSYHDSLPNMGDVSGLLEDEAGMEVVPNGQLTLSSPINMYKA
ncbi:hypothetical protein DPEC_G00320520 [Dallia pectoralis]|uniref:Uncharacterized protein n=1 Tax=Dallia pectoralis TaxID=75939 RepID=A0ACC2F9Z4_DALPE|nr:hypothetical protein DPEC_G00320520 [Dallia pectoralis]